MTNGVPITARIGYYVDQLAKVNGKWLFKSRQYRDWPPPTAIGGLPEP